MISRYYLQGKIQSVDNSIHYIAAKASPTDCGMLHFLTGTVKGAIESAAHNQDDMTDYPECRAIIFQLVMQLRNKFVELKQASDGEGLNDIRWCIDCLANIVVELEVTDEIVQEFMGKSHDDWIIDG